MSTQEKKTIGILGGMGPLATADLFQKIVLLTKADTDRDHIRVYIDSNANIPDRTAAILCGGEDPVPEMASALRHLEACGADCIIMPCNTAHYFLPRLQAMTEIPFLSILTAAAEACKAAVPRKNRGNSGYPRHAGGQSLSGGAGRRPACRIWSPTAPEQDALMRVIYDGVKAGKGPDSYRADFLTVLEQMSGRRGGGIPPRLHGAAAGGGSPEHRPAHGGSHGGAGQGGHPLLRVRRPGRMKLFDLFNSLN